jgi:hypothetical protein
VITGAPSANSAGLSGPPLGGSLEKPSEKPDPRTTSRAPTAATAAVRLEETEMGTADGAPETGSTMAGSSAASSKSTPAMETTRQGGGAAAAAAKGEGRGKATATTSPARRRGRCRARPAGPRALARAAKTGGWRHYFVHGAAQFMRGAGKTVHASTSFH